MALQSLEAALKSIARAIEPTKAQKKSAAASHRYLRSILRTGDIGGRIVGDYLSGSYARDTATRPLEDVDIIFLIDPEKWPRGFLGLGGTPRPSEVLQTFAGALRYRYERTSAFSQRRSIRLELNHVHIDCVPAIPLPETNYILVGDRKEDVWVRSSPKIHQLLISELNLRNGGYLKPIVKVLKAWNRSLPPAAQLRSFCIETMAVTVIRAWGCSSLEDGISKYFDFLSTFRERGVLDWTGHLGIYMDVWHGMVVPDLAGTGGNVASGVAPERMRRFQEQATRARELILAARVSKSATKASTKLKEAFQLNV